MESLYVAATIVYDALWWNFKNVYKYNLNTQYIRIGANYILQKHSRTTQTYNTYLENAGSGSADEH